MLSKIAAIKYSQNQRFRFMVDIIAYFCLIWKFWRQIFMLRGVNNRVWTYIYDTNRPNAMLCCVVPKAGRVDQHPCIHLIGMWPKGRPNPAYERSDSVKAILRCVTGAGKMALLCPNTPCGHEQIVPLWQIRFPNLGLLRHQCCPRWGMHRHINPVIKSLLIEKRFFCKSNKNAVFFI